MIGIILITIACTLVVVWLILLAIYGWSEDYDPPLEDIPRLSRRSKNG